MQKITPHLWFDKEAKEATAFYTTLFENSGIDKVNVIKDTPSGDCDMVSFHLAGQGFLAISAGPYFNFNPSISFFVVFDSESEIDNTWSKLAEGGSVLMEYNTYPWAKKYGWLNDKYGVSWQLSLGENPKADQKITPMIMYTKEMAGKAKEAIENYTSIFPNSRIEMMVPYEAGDGDKEGYIKHSRFTLAGQSFMAIESTLMHEFSFNESISFVVNCDTQEEIDYFWEKLSAVPEAEQCGWLKDKYGVSWQIVPTVMDELMEKSHDEGKKRITKSFLQMKKFDIATIEKAAKGE